MSCWFARFSVNIITTIIARKRFPCNRGGGDFADDDAEKVHKAIKDLLYAFGLPVMSDAIPWKIVEWWDPQGHIQMMRHIGRKLDEVVVGWIDEHRGRSMPHHGRGETDFIDLLLSQVGDGKLMFDKHGKDVVIVSTVESIIAGAVDTTSATLTWLITLLMNHPQVMTHAKGEINRVVGAERWVQHSDLVYLNAVIKETMRLYPAGSLGPPHMAVEDCLIGGFLVKRGTKLLCNIWKLQRDPSIWDDPNEFKPERFLCGGAGGGGGRVNVPKEHTFMYMPFGAGRRICPGKDFVMRVLPLVLARLIQGFEFSTPSGKPIVDVAEGFGAILHKAMPLDVVVTPRLPLEMYST